MSCWWVCCPRFAWNWRIPKSQGESNFAVHATGDIYLLSFLLDSTGICSESVRIESLSVGHAPRWATLRQPVWLEGTPIRRWPLLCHSFQTRSSANPEVAVLGSTVVVEPRPVWKWRDYLVVSGPGTRNQRAVRICTSSKEVLRRRDLNVNKCSTFIGGPVK